MIVVIARCSVCKKAIAGGWYGRYENEHVKKDSQDWIERGFLITMSENECDAKLEQHEESCPNHPKNS